MRTLRALGRAVANVLGAFVAIGTGAAVIAGAVVVTASVAAEPVPELDFGTGDLPHLSEVVSDEAAIPSRVYAADGTRVASFIPEATYIPIEAAEIPRNVVTAILAAEDANFFEHQGFDAQAIARAGARNLLAGETVQGGSTITQQLAKNLVTGDEETVERKIREVAVAMELEQDYSKYRLLAAYLNTSYFGEGAIGIVAAARAYFGKAVDDLSLSEAALLAGVLPAPSDWNPRADPEQAEVRRQYVLDQVLATGMALEDDVERARAEVPELIPKETSEADYPYYVDYVRRFLTQEAGFSMGDLLHGGLSIETSLDRSLQDVAQWTINENLQPHEPSASIVVLEPATGFVRALVGGRSWEESKVNLALGAMGGGSGRQSGSSFKTFTLMAALARGFQPHMVIPAPAEYQPDGADEPMGNYGGGGFGALTIEEATWRSVNTAYMYLTDAVGVDGIAQMARVHGIHIPPHPGPSITLGTYETTPLDMAAAYGAIAQQGRLAKPSPVTRVLDRDGNVLVEYPKSSPGQVVEPEVAQWTTQILRGALERGTGTRAAFGRPAAGKTGTTNDYRDAWFAGYTPQLAAAVWVGYPQANHPMVDVAGFPRVSGGSVPAIIWGQVMAHAHRDLPVADFPPPPPFPEPSADLPALFPRPEDGDDDDDDDDDEGDT